MNALICVAVALGFLALDRGWGGAAPLAAAGVGCLLALMDRGGAWSRGVWAGVAVGGGVAWWQGAAWWLGAVGVAVALMVWVEMAAGRVAVAPATGEAGAAARGAMRRRLMVAAAAAFVGVAVVPQLGGGATVLPGGALPVRVVVVGDSLSAGVPGDGAERRWPEVLESRLGDGAEVVNLSFPGDTAAGAWERWGDAVRSGAFAPSPGWRPDLYVVLLGGNDVRRRRAPAALEEDLAVWAREFQRQNVPALFVQVPGAAWGDPYRDVWRRVAAAHGAAHMGDRMLRTVFTSPRLTIMDRIHLNQEGHEYVADEVMRRLRGAD